MQRSSNSSIEDAMHRHAYDSISRVKKSMKSGPCYGDAHHVHIIAGKQAAVMQSLPLQRAQHESRQRLRGALLLAVHAPP